LDIQENPFVFSEQHKNPKFFKKEDVPIDKFRYAVLSWVCTRMKLKATKRKAVKTSWAAANDSEADPVSNPAKCTGRVHAWTATALKMERVLIENDAR
jgi:hypothetical protein